MKKIYYYIFQRKSKWNYLFFAIILSPLIYFSFHNKHAIENGNYTIGYATRLYWPIISYNRVNYYYFVNSKKFEDDNDYSSYDKLIIPHLNYSSSVFSTIFIRS